MGWFLIFGNKDLLNFENLVNLKIIKLRFTKSARFSQLSLATASTTKHLFHPLLTINK